MYFLLKMVIFHHCYVSLPEGTFSNGWFSIVMLVYWRVVIFVDEKPWAVTPRWSRMSRDGQAKSHIKSSCLPLQSGDSWMYPYQRTPMGNPYISPIYPYIVGVYGLLSPTIPREHNKHHGYTVRGTPHCPLIQQESRWCLPGNECGHQQERFQWHVPRFLGGVKGLV